MIIRKQQFVNGQPVQSAPEPDAEFLLDSSKFTPLGSEGLLDSSKFVPEKTAKLAKDMNPLERFGANVKTGFGSVALGRAQNLVGQAAAYGEAPPLAGLGGPTPFGNLPTGLLGAAPPAVTPETYRQGMSLAGKDLAAFSAKWMRENVPGGQNFGDEAVGAVGSMFAILPESFVAGLIGGPNAAAAVAAVVESAAEQGNVEAELIDRYKMDPDEAHRRSEWVFLANLPIGYLTDRALLRFLPDSPLMRQLAPLRTVRAKAALIAKDAGLAATREGVQETSQELISTVAVGDKIEAGRLLHAGAIGATVGGGMSALAIPGAIQADRAYVGQQLEAGFQEGPMGSRPTFSPIMSNPAEERRIGDELENDPAMNPRLARTPAELEVAEIDAARSTHGATSTAPAAKPAPVDLGGGWETAPSPFTASTPPEDGGMPMLSRRADSEAAARLRYQQAPIRSKGVKIVSGTPEHDELGAELEDIFDAAEATLIDQIIISQEALSGRKHTYEGTERMVKEKRGLRVKLRRALGEGDIAARLMTSELDRSRALKIIADLEKTWGLDEEAELLRDFLKRAEAAGERLMFPPAEPAAPQPAPNPLELAGMRKDQVLKLYYSGDREVADAAWDELERRVMYQPAILSKKTGIPLAALSDQALYAYWDALEFAHEQSGGIFGGEAALLEESSRVRQTIWARKEQGQAQTDPALSQAVMDASSALIINDKTPTGHAAIDAMFGLTGEDESSSEGLTELGDGPRFSRSPSTERGGERDWRAAPYEYTLRGLKLIAEETPDSFRGADLMALLKSRQIPQEEQQEVWMPFVAAAEMQNPGKKIPRSDAIAWGRRYLEQNARVEIKRGPEAGFYESRSYRGPGVNYTTHAELRPDWAVAQEPFWAPAHESLGHGNLSHSRLVDVVTPEGEPVLFSDEVQSDLHQNARDWGYRPKLDGPASPPAPLPEMRDYVAEMTLWQKRLISVAKWMRTSEWADGPNGERIDLGARSLMYRWDAAQNKLHRAILNKHLIKLLEKKGYRVEILQDGDGLPIATTEGMEESDEEYRQWRHYKRLAENYANRHNPLDAVEKGSLFGSMRRNLANRLFYREKLAEQMEAALSAAAGKYYPPGAQQELLDLLEQIHLAREEIRDLFVNHQPELVHPSVMKLASIYGYYSAMTFTGDSALNDRRGLNDGASMSDRNLLTARDEVLTNALADWYERQQPYAEEQRQILNSREEERRARADTRPRMNYRVDQGGVPYAPHKESWTRRAAGRHVMEAVRQGAKHVAWTTGKEQAVRWQEAMRGAATEVRWARYENGDIEVSYNTVSNPRRFNVIVYEKKPDGKYVYMQPARYGQDEVPWTLSKSWGPDVSRMMLEQEKGKLEGDEIVFGSAGFEVHYDQKYPKALKSFLGPESKPELAEHHVPKAGWTAMHLGDGSGEQLMGPSNWHVIDGLGGFDASPVFGREPEANDDPDLPYTVRQVEPNAYIGNADVSRWEIWWGDDTLDDGQFFPSAQEAMRFAEHVIFRNGWFYEGPSAPGESPNLHTYQLPGNNVGAIIVGLDDAVEWLRSRDPEASADGMSDGWYAVISGLRPSQAEGGVQMLGPFDQMEEAASEVESYLDDILRDGWPHMTVTDFSVGPITGANAPAPSAGPPRPRPAWRMGIPQQAADAAAAGEFFLFKRDLDGDVTDDWAEFFRRQSKVKAQTVGQKIAEKFGKTLGLEVVFINADRATGFHGAFLGNVPGYGSRVVMINAASPNLTLTIMAHEAIHYMKASHPDLYIALHAVVQDMVATKDPRYRAFKAKQKKSYKQLKLNISDDQIFEEFIADLLGEMITDPKFWVKLAAKNMPAFQSLRTRVREMMKHLRGLITGDPNGVFLRDLVRDMKAVEDAMSTALAEMAKRQAAADVAEAAANHTVGTAQFDNVVAQVNKMAAWRFGPVAITARANYVQDGDVERFGEPIDPMQDYTGAVARLIDQGVKTILGLSTIHGLDINRYRQWYREHLERAMAIIEKEIPGVTTDPAKRGFVNFVLAITSPGVSLETNYNHSLNVLLSWLRDGKWPIETVPAMDYKTGAQKVNKDGTLRTKRQVMSYDPAGGRPLVVGGKSLNTVTGAFDRFDRLINAMPGSTQGERVAQALEWLETRHSWSEFHRIFGEDMAADESESGDIVQDEGGKSQNSWITKTGKHLGSMAFGPKVSRYFENLQGRHELAVFDRWFSYWGYRRIGQSLIVAEDKKTQGRSLTLKEAPGKKTDWAMFDKAMLEIASRMGEITGNEWGVDEVQAVLWFAEKAEFIAAGLEKQAGRIGEYDVAGLKRAKRLGYEEEAQAAVDRVGTARGPRNPARPRPAGPADAADNQPDGVTGSGASGETEGQVGTPRFSRDPKPAGPAAAKIMKREADRIAEIEAAGRRSWGDRWHLIRRMLFDQNGSLDWRVVEALRAADKDPKALLDYATKNPYVLTRLLAAGPSVASAIIRRGVPAVDNTDKIVHDGLDVILARHKIDSEQKQADLNIVLVANQLEDYDTVRKTRRDSKKAFVSPDELEQYKAARAEVMTRPYAADIAAAAAEVASFNNAFLSWARDMGIVSPALFDKLVDMYKRWVPIHELALVGPDGKPRASGLSASAGPSVKSAYGFDAGFVPARPLDTIQRNVHYMVTTALENRVKLALARLADEIPGVIDHAQPKRERVTLSREEAARAALESADVDLSDAFLENLMGDVGLETEDLAALRSIWRVSSYMEDGVIAYREGGKVRYLKVDPAIYQVFYDMYTGHADDLIKLLSLPNKAFRAGVTSTLGFVVSNLTRDYRAALVYGKTLPTPLEMVRGLVAPIRKNQDYWSWVFAQGGNVAAVSPDQALERIRKLNQSKAGRFAYHVMHPIQAMQLLSETSDQVNRVPQYLARRRALEAKNKKAAPGKAKSIQDIIYEAGFDSRQPGLDFFHGGTLVKQANRVTAFLNAKVLGQAQLAMAMKDRPVRTVAMGLALYTLPAVALWFWQRDEEWYKRQPDWMKFMYHIIPMDEDGRNIALIPKGQELAYLFASAPEAMLNAWYQKDPKAASAWAERFAKNLSWVELPTALKPYYEAVVANHDSFKDAPVESPSMQQMKTQERYSASTPEAMIWAGSTKPAQLLNLSPAQLTHLVHGYFGTWGKTATNLVSDLVTAIDPARRRPVRSKHKLWGVVPMERTWFVGRYFRSSLASESVYLERFDDATWESTASMRALRRGMSKNRHRPDDLRKLITEDIGQLLLFQSLNQAADDIQSVNDYIMQIEAEPEGDGKFTADEKRDIRDSYVKKIDTMAKEAMAQRKALLERLETEPGFKAEMVDKALADLEKNLAQYDESMRKQKENEAWRQE